MIVADTNLLIEYLNDQRKTVDWLKRATARGEKFAISTVTVMEVLAYPKLTPRTIGEIEDWLSEFTVFDVDMAQARIAARLRRDHKFHAIDSIIAALAVILDVPFATHDIKLHRIMGIKVISP